MNTEIIKNKIYDRNSILADLKVQKDKMKKASEKMNTADKVLVLYQETTKKIQNNLKVFIDGVNQQALDITFPGYTFKVEFTIKNNVTHAGIYVENHGRKQKPMESNGGGLGNIISICSQIGCKKMSHTRDTIFADQPMADLSKGPKEQLAMEMLKKITGDMGIQYIMISHVDAQIDAADNVIEAKIKPNEKLGYPVSSVKCISK